MVAGCQLSGKAVSLSGARRDARSCNAGPADNQAVRRITGRRIRSMATDPDGHAAGTWPKRGVDNLQHRKTTVCPWRAQGKRADRSGWIAQIWDRLYCNAFQELNGRKYSRLVLMLKAAGSKNDAMRCGLVATNKYLIEYKRYVLTLGLRLSSPGIRE